MKNVLRGYICVALMMLFALDSWAGQHHDGYNVAEYQEAKKAYETIYPLSDSRVRQNLALADSIFNVGVKQQNYMVQLLGLMSRMDVELRAEKYEDALVTAQRWVSLAEKYHNQEYYFKGRYRLCDITQYINPSKSMLMTRELIQDAVKQKYEPGLAFGYNLLGEINMYHRYEYRDAADNLRRALALRNRCGAEGPGLVRLMTEYASALVELNEFEKAESILDSIPLMEGKLSDTDKTSIDVIKLDMAYNRNIRGEEYDRIHQRATNNKNFDRLYFEDSQLFYHVRWLIRTGQEEEALRQIPNLELNIDRLQLTRDAYASLGNYEAAFRLDEPIKALRDSILSELRNQDFEAIEAQIQIVEITEQARTMRNRQRLIIALMISGVLFLALLVAIYIVRRRKHHMQQLEQKNSELREMNARLEQAIKSKTQFMQYVTHELHTPLNALNGFSTVLCSPDMEFNPQETREIAHTIHCSCLAFVLLIDDIIRISEFEDPAYVPTHKACNPAEMLAQALESSPIPVEKSGLTIERRFTYPRNFMLSTNQDMVVLALRNLVSNAIKFTERGSVTLEAILSEDAKSFDFVITDTGIGIPVSECERVFDRFYQINPYIPGAGLGLNVCRLIATKLHGIVYIDTAYTQQGTRMVFRLPAEAE